MAPRILFVNKLAESCSFLSVLEKRGYHILRANNGLKLISQLEVEQPDLIIMDTKSSWPNSFNLCSALRRGKYRSIPVFFLSPKHSKEEFDRSRECGASNYFSLPGQMDNFLSSVKEVCGSPKNPSGEYFL